ncbi:MAG: metallophosphoesterase [Anaerolineae bacterium]|nr:metallophosphoesterase [Anaerolineae bacterium]
MRFIQITDTHLGPTPDYLLRGTNTYRILEKLVDLINRLPFQAEFVIHTGDVIDDMSAESYKVAKSVLERIKRPIYYLVGNHDNTTHLQKILLGKKSAKKRLDYQFEAGGVEFAVFDTHGNKDPSGLLLPEQIKLLREICKPRGKPLMIVTHHQPVPLDVPWLDNGAIDWMPGQFMKIENSEEFLDAILPARKRIRGVMFGHVHRGFQTTHKGIFFFSSPSSSAQLESWPDSKKPDSSDDEMPGFNIVTVDADGIIVRQHHFRP